MHKEIWSWRKECLQDFRYCNVLCVMLSNICFIKNDEELITFENGFNNSQLDFFLTRVIDQATCKVTK